MSFYNAAIAKSRAKQFGAANTYGSLLSNNPIGDASNFSTAEKEAEILGTARKDFYKTVVDAKTNYFNELGNQQAALQGSTNFADGLGIIGSGLSGGINTAFDFGLLKRKL